jgi:hypothetical protein
MRCAALEIKTHEVENVWRKRAKPKFLRPLMKRWCEQSGDGDVLANSFRHGSDEKQVLRSALFEAWVSCEPVVKTSHAALAEREWRVWRVFDCDFAVRPIPEMLESSVALNCR